MARGGVPWSETCLAAGQRTLVKPYGSRCDSNPTTPQMGLEPSQNSEWDLNSWAGTRTHCLLTEIALLVSGLKEWEFCFMLESPLWTRLFFSKEPSSRLIFKSNYTVYEHCIYSYFTVIFINDLQKKPYDQDQQCAFPSLQTCSRYCRKDKVSFASFFCKGCHVVPISVSQTFVLETILNEIGK